MYFFKDISGRVIYVGKAKLLKNRVKQYFQKKPQPGKTGSMVSKISDFDIISTDTEVEALILEFNMIKELKPRYNINLKDDKTYPYIVITNDSFPRVLPTRNKRSSGGRYFGPYTDVKAMRFALKSIRDIFMIRSCSLNLSEVNINSGKFKLCLDYYIQKCEGPCVGLVSKAEYNKTINQVAKLLNGKITSLEKELKEQMANYAERMMFEQAARIRDKIKALHIYSAKQKMVDNEGIDRDVFVVEQEDNDACGMVLKIRDGRVVGKAHFYFTNTLEKFTEEVLENLVTNYYSGSDFIPDEIILQKETENLTSIKKWLENKKGTRVNLLVPKNGDKLKLINMVLANAKLMLEELKLAKLKRDYIAPSLTSLQRDLKLNRLPLRIDCFDISHIQGTDTVASMVVFQDAKPKKSEYRKYKLQSVTNETGKPDDFISMREVVHRRYRRFNEEASNFPDLIVIDGGKGQLSSAVKVLADMGVKIAEFKNETSQDPVKAPYIIGLAKRLEEVYIPEDPDPLIIPKTSSGLILLQKIRDEAHRFAVEFHRSLRNKRTITSELIDIKGIGEATAKKLLSKYESFQGVKEALKKDEQEFELHVGKRVTGILIKYFYECE